MLLKPVGTEKDWGWGVIKRMVRLELAYGGDQGLRGSERRGF